MFFGKYDQEYYDQEHDTTGFCNDIICFGNYWIEMRELWGVDPVFKREMKDKIWICKHYDLRKNGGNSYISWSPDFPCNPVNMGKSETGYYTVKPHNLIFSSRNCPLFCSSSSHPTGTEVCYQSPRTLSESSVQESWWPVCAISNDMFLWGHVGVWE